MKKLILEKHSEYKIFLPLTNLIDLFNDENYSIVDNLKCYHLLYKNINIGNIKIAKKRITLNLNNPTITLYFGCNTNNTNNTNLELLKNFQNNIWL